MFNKSEKKNKEFSCIQNSCVLISPSETSFHEDILFASRIVNIYKSNIVPNILFHFILGGIFLEHIPTQSYNNLM